MSPRTTPDATRAGATRRAFLMTGAGGLAAGAATLAGATSAQAAPTAQGGRHGSPRRPSRRHAFTFTTLGTMSGPVPSPDRSQPAHVLHDAERAILVDVGDGAVQQLAKAGISLAAVGTLVVSHLHVDHTAGLLGLLGARIQARIAVPLQVYGPVGTRDMVDQTVRGPLGYLQRLMGGNVALPPVAVTEIADGSTFAVGDVAVTAAKNNHFGFEPGSEQDQQFQSFSLRFDMPDRSIAYTGDTGPDDAVTALARGADLLVSEIMDPQQALDDLRPQLGDLTPEQEAQLLHHFEAEHLNAQAVGELARDAQVDEVVLVHNPLNAATTRAARGTLARLFRGRVTFADDLDGF